MNRLAGHLPERFPIGTRYVVEAYGGNGGHLRIHLRYLEFPDGRRVKLPARGRDGSRSRHRRRSEKATTKK